MSRPKRGREGGSRSRGGRGGGGGRQRTRRADYSEVPKNNDLYEKYYNELGIFAGQDQNDFWAALRRELPNSFRFTGSKAHALQVQQRLKDHYIPEITAIHHNDEPVNPPTPLLWYPDQLAWHMTTPKSVIRRFPSFASFQKFLVSETSVGNISRQEAVSMIPPLLMDIRPGMTVLDLCAAPGSKAAQLIEMVHGGEEARMGEISRRAKQSQKGEMGSDERETQAVVNDEERGEDWSDDGRTTGLLIANDIDYKRAHMLIHQMKRLNSPNLIVTNHDATLYPSIKLPSEPNPDNKVTRGKYLKFDRILADVPCSGDGTSRKNVNVWRDWNPGNSLGLFQTQVRILVRALQMLKVGGRVVYSTCSMNPVENEAVVATAIDRCGGLEKVTILDCDDALPQLKRKPGLKSWKVMDRQGNIWDSWRDVEAHRVNEGHDGLGKLSESMFAPLNDVGSPLEIPLDRCIRIYSHQQDTGAFFITVLEKVTEFKARTEGEPRKSGANFPKSISKPSIIAVVEEIESWAVDGENSIGHTKSLDDFAPPQNSTGIDGGTSAAARQNQENIVNDYISPEKHTLDGLTDARAATKRPKIREEVPDLVFQCEGDRQIHYPPPPGAQLGLSRNEENAPSAYPESSVPASSQPTIGNKKMHQPFEEPFKFLDPNHEELQTIYEFYKLHPRFPRDRFMVRNPAGAPSKTIYYTSALARSILTENEGKGIKFVHCGIKMFVKQDVQKEGVCEWRTQTDGLSLLEAWIGEERVVKLWSKKTLRSLLVEMFPKVTGAGWQDLGEIGERVRDIGMGCCLLRVDPRGGEDGFHERMALPLWRSLYSLNLMLPKEERKAMLLRIYNEDTPLMDHSKDRFTAKPKATSKQDSDKDAMIPEEEALTIESDDAEEDGGVVLADGGEAMDE